MDIKVFDKINQKQKYSNSVILAEKQKERYNYENSSLLKSYKREKSGWKRDKNGDTANYGNDGMAANEKSQSRNNYNKST